MYYNNSNHHNIYFKCSTWSFDHWKQSINFTFFWDRVLNFQMSHFRQLLGSKFKTMVQILGNQINGEWTKASLWMNSVPLHLNIYSDREFDVCVRRSFSVCAKIEMPSWMNDEDKKLSELVWMLVFRHKCTHTHTHSQTMLFFAFQKKKCWNSATLN